METVTHRESKPAKSSFAGDRRIGFTLIELLVVVGIIGVLACLLFPAISTALANAQAIQCVSNLRQVYDLFLFYTQDNDSQIPPAYNSYTYTSVGIPSGNGWVSYEWTAQTNSRRVFACPSQIAYARAGKFPGYASYGATMPTYSMNSTLANDYWNGPGANGTGGAAGAPMKRTMQFFRFPAESVIFTDGAIAASTTNAYNSGVNGNPADKFPQAVHGGAANLCFLDGHVQRMKNADIPSYNANTDYTAKLGQPASIFWLGR